MATIQRGSDEYHVVAGAGSTAAEGEGEREGEREGYFRKEQNRKRQRQVLGPRGNKGKAQKLDDAFTSCNTPQQTGVRVAKRRRLTIPGWFLQCSDALTDLGKIFLNQVLLAPTIASVTNTLPERSLLYSIEDPSFECGNFKCERNTDEGTYSAAHNFALFCTTWKAG